MQISHLIFTRFNIQYEAGDAIGIQPNWLDERLRLFEQYCLPSIQHQTCPDFTWLLLGDSNTPDNYKTRIENYALRIPQLKVYWLLFSDDAYHGFYRQIGHTFAQGKDILISTRLDSDDALSNNYVELIQQVARDGKEGIASFPEGRQIFLHDNKSYRVRYVPNHFTSRIERSGFETIMVFDHTQIDPNDIHVIGTDKPMWEEIIHGGNILNDYVPKYRYYITGFADALDLSRRWIRFQIKRLTGFWKSHFILAHKR